MIIKANNPGEAWANNTDYVLKNGTKYSGLIEVLNLVLEIENFTDYSDFDILYREVFDETPVDFFQSVTFIKPEKVKDPFIGSKLNYQQYDPKNAWTKSYWGRLIQWGGNFNQIEQAIKRIKEGKNSKTIVAQVHDPDPTAMVYSCTKDGKKTQGLPCLMGIDFKPRGDDLYLTAFWRSQAVSFGGYADYQALTNMGKFICEETGLNLKRVTSIAGSCHVRSIEGELKRSQILLEKIGVK